MTDRIDTEYPGALTTRLVNREDILHKIKAAIEEKGSAPVLYITGDGGVGKTFLLQEVLRRCRKEGEWHTDDLVAGQDVVDFYHTYTHTMEGLLRALWKVLQPVQPELTAYERAMQVLEERRPDLAGWMARLAAYRADVAKHFLDDLGRLSRDRRLVLAFDTAEQLRYELDWVQEDLGLKGEGVAVLPWLLQEFLPGLRNAVVLIAGRPDSRQLHEDLEGAVGNRLVPLDLGGFEKPEEAVEYFQAAAERAEEVGRNRDAERIRAVPEDTRKVIWHYTRGRSIMLALMIDYLLMKDRLLDEVKISFEEAQAKDEAECRAIEDKMEVALVTFFQEAGRPDDEAIRALAWARKGLDARMLARVAGMDEEEATKSIRRLRELSFIKFHPASERLFLHDEMYQMLDRHVLKGTSWRARKRVYEALLACYADLIEEAREEVEARHRPAVEVMDTTESRRGAPAGFLSSPKEARAMTQATDRLYRLMAEEVYYRLRRDPADGFKAYATYRQEGLWANDENLDMQLRSAMLDFLEERKEAGEDLDGLPRRTVELDHGLGWIQRLIRRGDYEEALRVAQAIRETRRELLQSGDLPAQARLDALEGKALTYLAHDLGQAGNLLIGATEALEGFEPVDKFQEWLRDVTLADALNTLGYLRRTEGRYHESVEAYQRAVTMWRALVERETSPTMKEALQAQHANTLNNLGLALAWVGKFHQAQLKARDALGLRRELGPLVPMAFSLNTLGLIQVKSDEPHRGRLSSERALQIFSELEQPRGVGLARIALAEAYRRMASLPELYALEERVEQLRQAVQHAEQAVEIFEREDTREPARQVEALIELGCAYREWACIRDRYQDSDLPKDELAKRGVYHLEDAIEKAKREPRLGHLAVDAQVNLAWLRFYMGDPVSAEKELKEATDRVGDEYKFRPGQPPPPKDLPQAFLWVQVGKAHLLRGEMARERFEEGEKDADLKEVARHYTLSLAYNARFAEDFRDLRRGKERIHEALKGLNQREMETFQKGVDETAEEYGLEMPTRMHKFLQEYFGLSLEPEPSSQ